MSIPVVAYLVTGLGFAVFAVNFRSPVGPQILVSLPVLALLAMSVWASWQAWRAVRERAGRRFWRLVCIGMAFGLTGQLIDIRSYLHGPVPDRQSALLMAYSLVPFLTVLVAMYRVPLGARSRGERQRMLLDVMTVALGAAVIVWYFWRAQRGTLSHEIVGVSSAAIVLAAVILFGLFKVVMSGSRSVDALALRLFSCGLLVEVVGILAAPLVPSRPGYTIEIPARCVGHLMVVVAAVRAWRVAGRTGAGDKAGRRGYSVLPYVAVAAVDALLLVTLFMRLAGQVVITLAAVALTGLVIARQIGAFRDNAHQASHDALTDLANRSLFGWRLDQALAGTATRPVSLALIDLDDFKSVNDTLGHQAGDALLLAVAERLRRVVRPQDLVARLGGDEFAVILEIAGADRAEAVADRLLAVLTEPLTIDGHEVCVQASVGIAEAEPGDDADGLVRRADLALYEAKGAGKGCYVRYAEHMRARVSSRAESAADLHRALQAGEFVLHYQPIVALPSGRLTGVEALLRWRHPTRGLVPPLDFIPAAEETGMIVPIGQWVLGQACRDMAAWLADHPDTAPEVVNVNVSPRQARAADFVAGVFAALHQSGLPAGRLVLEVVESTIVGDVAPAFRQLREAGVRIALDDFGTGFSTLSLLDAFPVDELKLDRSFVREPGQDQVATVVARMAEVLGVHVVAEGVETREQAEHLHRLGYGLAQGFHFARPVPAAELADLLRRGPVPAAR